MPTITEFMKKYGPGAQNQQAQQTQEQPKRRTIDEFMKQYGGANYQPAQNNQINAGSVFDKAPQPQGYQAGPFNIPAPQTVQQQARQSEAAQRIINALQPKPAQPDPQKREAYLQELAQLQENAPNVASAEQGLANAQRRREITNELEAMDIREGNAPRYYDEATRAGGVLEGWANRTGGSYLSTVGTLGQLAEAQDETGKKLTDSDYSGFLTDEMAIQQARQAVENGWEPQSIGTFKTNREMLEKADELLGRNEEIMAKVYNEAGKADRLLADVTGGALDLASDAVLNKILPGAGLVAMGTRSFGQGSYEQRKEGKGLGKQFLGGAKSAAIEVLTEKIGGPFENVYGKTLTGKAMKGLLGKLNNPIVKNGLKLASGFFSEGLEEFLGDVLNPVADRLLKLDDGTGKIFKDGWFGDAMYDAVIGGLLGLAGEGVNLSGAGEAFGQQKTESQRRADARRGALEAVERAIDERMEAGKPAGSPGTKADILARMKAASEADANGGNTNVLNTLQEIAADPDQNLTFKKLYGVDAKATIRAIQQMEQMEAEAGQNEQNNAPAAESPSEATGAPVTQGDIPAPAEGVQAPVAQADEFNSKPEATESEQTQTEQSIDDRARQIYETPYEDEFSGTQQREDWNSTGEGSKLWAYLEANGVDSNSLAEGSGAENRAFYELLDLLDHGGDLPASAAAQAFAEAKANGKMNIPEIVSRAYEIAGKEMPSGVRSQYMPTAQDRADRAKLDESYAKEIASYFDTLAKKAEREGNTEYAQRMRERAAEERAKAKEAGRAVAEAAQQTGQSMPEEQSGTGTEVRNDTSSALQAPSPQGEGIGESGKQPGMKRSKTESHTLQHMADVTGGQQEELYYVPKSEQESLTNAMNRVRSDMNGEMQKLMDKEMWNGEDIDTGLTIMGLLQMDGVRTGDFSAAQAWSRIVQARGTESGRALQAFSKWTRSGVAAATQSMNALTEARNLTEEQKTQITNDVYQFAQEYDSIEDGDLKSIRELIKKQAKYRNTWTFGKKGFGKYLNEITDFDWLKEYAMRQMMNISADFTEEADLGQKAKTWQVNAQLSRLGTFFRNIGGNGVFGVQDTLSQDFFGVALDALVGKATGKRTVAADKGWLSSQARKGARQGLVRSILEVAGDVDMGEGGSKYGQGSNRTFKMTGKSFDRMMSRWEQLLGYSLTSSDRTFRGAIEAEQMRGLENFENLTEEERQALAQNMADYRLFQNQGAVAGSMKGLHDAANKLLGFGGKIEGKYRQGGFGIADLVMPYPGVPANLWAKSMEYSPANVVKGTVELVKLLKDIKNGKSWSVTQQQNAVMDVARGIHGTLLVAGLAALFKAGIFRNADDEDDPDAKALAAAEGRQGVQVNLSAALRWANGGSREWKQGDELMKIDWLEPMNAFLAIASMAADDLDNPGAYMMDTMEGSVQALLDMPVMTPISNIVDSYKYSKAETTAGKVGETLLNFGVDSLTGMLPAFVSQTARATDPYYRETAGDTAAETALNRVMNAIPGLRQQLNPKLDNFGRPKEQADSAYDRWMNSFVRPGQISDYKAGEMEQALDALAERTGDPDVYPDRKAPNSFTVGGEKIQLDDDQKQLYQRTYGLVCERYYNTVLNGDEFSGLSDAEKSWMLDEIRDYATYKARSAVLERQGKGSSPDKNGIKLDSVLRTGVDLPGYLLGKQNANADGGDFKNIEVFDWLFNSDYTQKQQAAIWAANSSGGKSWSEYKATNPVAILAGFGIKADNAKNMADAIDPEWSSVKNFSQEELWNYYLSHPKQEAAIKALWEAKGGKTSWESYKAKHGK